MDRGPKGGQYNSTWELNFFDKVIIIWDFLKSII